MKIKFLNKQKIIIQKQCPLYFFESSLPFLVTADKNIENYTYGCLLDAIFVEPLHDWVSVDVKCRQTHIPRSQIPTTIIYFLKLKKINCIWLFFYFPEILKVKLHSTFYKLSFHITKNSHSTQPFLCVSTQKAIHSTDAV